MNKKIIGSIVLLIFLMIGVPFILLFFDFGQTKGKIVINKKIEAPYLQNSTKKLQLVFYGYVGCTRVCTPMLYRLADFYNSAAFADLKPSVGFSFVNLMPEVKPDEPEKFATFFNPAFDGVYLNQKELMSIDRKLSLFFSKRLTNPDEIDHSDYLYLVERQKNGDLILLNIYTTHPLNQELLIKDIDNRLKGD